MNRIPFENYHVQAQEYGKPWTTYLKKKRSKQCFHQGTKKGLNVRQGKDNSPRRPIHSPLEGYKAGRTHDHATNDDHRKQDLEPKPLDDLWNFLEEIRSLYFFDGSAPSDVVRKQVR